MFCKRASFDLMAVWDAADRAERTKLLGGLFERIEAHVVIPEPAIRKFRTKRDAEAAARLLTDHGREIEWVRPNYGAQRQLTWNIRLVNGVEVHNTGHSKNSG
jgi:hypothetical protein